MTTNKEKFEYTHALEADGQQFHVRSMIPYNEKEQFAQDYAASALIFDQDTGLVYEGYNANLVRGFLILVNYTDLEIAEYDTPTGRPELCDMIASHGLWEKIMGIIEEDLKQVNGICDLLVYGARKTFEQKHSLEYRMNKVFASLLGTEDLAETIAKAEGLNSKLIDLFGMVRNEEKKPGEGTGLRFDKKSD